MADEEEINEQDYRIKDWMPPWVDNGARLKQLVDFLVEQNDEDAWKILMVMLVNQIDEDIARLRYIVQELNSLEGIWNDEQ